MVESAHLSRGVAGAGNGARRGIVITVGAVRQAAFIRCRESGRSRARVGKTSEDLRQSVVRRLPRW